jgi:hypothetical protein
MIDRQDIPLFYEFCETVEQMIDSMTDLQLLQFISECRTASNENCWWIARGLSNAILPIVVNTLQLREEIKDSIYSIDDVIEKEKTNGEKKKSKNKKSSKTSV